MAFTQKGTTLSSAGTFPTCLDYLKRLGVGYVQLMPIFDFGSVDESRPLTRQYNWGYDPTNYNVPEGSYSTDPTKGEVRVRECKEMIASLHAAGIGVIMDVVYNHMYRSENPLNSTVPYYFFRQNPDGSFSNGSGCGNEFASERPMARKYLIDSVLYWAQGISHRRLPLRPHGLYDVDTMNELRAALDALPGGRSILMYGEPWQGGGSQLHRYEANKANLAMLSERIGVFCDNTRDVIKGGCFDAGSRVTSRANRAASGTSAGPWPRGAAATSCPPIRPLRSSAMCPPTTISLSGITDARPVRPARVHCRRLGGAGPEPAGGGHLSYLHGDALHAGRRGVRPHQKRSGQQLPLFASLNRLDWKRAAQFHGLVDYYRGLLGLRAQFPRLSAPDTASPAAIKFFSLEQPLVGWTLPAAPGDGAAWRALCVFYNPTEDEKRVRLPDGQWKLLSDGVSSALWKGPSRVCGGEVTLLPYSATIFGQV